MPTLLYYFRKEKYNGAEGYELQIIQDGLLFFKKLGKKIYSCSKLLISVFIPY